MDQDQKAFALARQSLKAFCLLMIPGFEVSPHHALMLARIEALLGSTWLRGTKRLATVCPPRHGKSLIASVALPAFFLGKNPRSHVIVASYGSELAEGFGRRARDILQAENFARIFPRCILSPDSAAAHRFSTVAGGEAYFVGRGGPLTGRGGDLLVLDDLVKDAQEANSDAVCRSIVEWLQHVCFTRLSRNGKVLVISTRWSERDPIGWLLREKGWEVLHLPAISEGAGDPLGRPEGEALWESQYPARVLENIRAAIGPSAWSSLYQGNPTAAQGAVFRRIWFRRYRTVPEKFEKITMSLDTAFKTGAANDYSVATVWGVTSNGYYLLNLWRDRVEFPALVAEVSALAENWGPSEILVEDRASGQSLIQELKNSTRFPVIPVKVDSDKSVRANATTGFFAAGKVYFPEGAAWTTDVEDELASFPNGTHDDIVDSITQFLNYSRGGSWIFSLAQLQAEGEMLGALEEKPRAIITTFPSHMPEGNRVGVPVPPPKEQEWDNLPSCCPRCGGPVVLAPVPDGHTALVTCAKCRWQVQVHERSQFAPSIPQTRGEWLAGQERQPGRFGRVGRRSLFGRFGG